MLMKQQMLQSDIIPHNPMALSLQFTSSTVMFGVLEHTKQWPFLLVSFLDVLSTKEDVRLNYFLFYSMILSNNCMFRWRTLRFTRLWF